MRDKLDMYKHVNENANNNVRINIDININKDLDKNAFFKYDRNETAV